MAPLLALGLIAGAATAALLYSRRNAIKGQTPDALPGVVDILSKGRTYAVLVAVAAQDGRPGHKSIQTLQVPTASANLKNIYEILGFKVLSAPVLRNAAETSDFLHKNPSIWLFNGQWTKDDAAPPLAADFILSQTFTTLPVQ